MTKPQGVDVLILPAITDLKESWYGMEIDKTKYSIALENETEESVYLKIVNKKTYQQLYLEAVGEEE